MATVAEILESFVDGRIELEEVLADFEQRRWVPARQEPGGLTLDEGAPPQENSFEIVSINSRLTENEYQQMAAAYERSLVRKNAA